MTRGGTLHLVPTPLAAGDIAAVLPASVIACVRQLDYFLVEAPKTARAFLRLAGHPVPIAALRIEPIPEDDHDIEALLEEVLAGRDAGVMSEAGAPGVADPGARVVRTAHRIGLRVWPHVGPSSLLLALMASGLEGQRFAFHGYLPVDEGELVRRLHALERASRTERATQAFIETPYRNDRLMRVLLETCAPSTLVCVATQLTAADEAIATRTIEDWRRAPPTIGKRPTVFLLLASAA